MVYDTRRWAGFVAAPFPRRWDMLLYESDGYAPSNMENYGWKLKSSQSLLGRAGKSDFYPAVLA